MAKSIWKFTLEVTDEQSVAMPYGAKLLRVMVQRDQVCLWAEVAPDTISSMRYFRIYGTGHVMPDDPEKYVDSFMLNGGTLVFHVYEV